MEQKEKWKMWESGCVGIERFWGKLFHSGGGSWVLRSGKLPFERFRFRRTRIQVPGVPDRKRGRPVPKRPNHRFSWFAPVWERGIRFAHITEMQGFTMEINAPSPIDLPLETLSLFGFGS